MPRPIPQNIRKAFRVLARAGIDSGTVPLIVGGFVRDWIIGEGFEEINDFDVMTRDNNSKVLAQAFSEASGYENGYTTYGYTGTMMVYNNGLKFEFQSDNNPHVHFDIIPDMQELGVQVTPLTKNIYERDFTINTLCYDLINNKILDVTGYGVQDLYHDRILRTPITAIRAIENNPFILLRMVRFQIQFDLELDQELALAVPNGIAILRDRMHERSPKMVNNIVRSTFNLNPDKADELYKKYGLYDILDDRAIPKKYKRKALFDELEQDYQSRQNTEREMSGL